MIGKYHFFFLSSLYYRMRLHTLPFLLLLTLTVTVTRAWVYDPHRRRPDDADPMRRSSVEAEQRPELLNKRLIGKLPFFESAQPAHLKNKRLEALPIRPHRREGQKKRLEALPPYTKAVAQVNHKKRKTKVPPPSGNGPQSKRDGNEPTSGVDTTIAHKRGGELPLIGPHKTVDTHDPAP
ncbi:uncharacterized protein FA14DRAFT_185628 [Meira miltonrushii]|uniref:Uncharacterized protein n=1 Tax=Meira miltonrushii TaxID=1280837 RepID=A0A316V7W4_9BASI|nr:uncharacterized protein FA14DRAFT_185628 [Meira miltonrushii]PWN32561.1 hypothetical protein FA14DRAFT_185628 [Meira miltonrushii]